MTSDAAECAAATRELQQLVLLRDTLPRELATVRMQIDVRLERLREAS